MYFYLTVKSSENHFLLDLSVGSYQQNQWQPRLAIMGFDLCGSPLKEALSPQVQQATEHSQEHITWQMHVRLCSLVRFFCVEKPNVECGSKICTFPHVF